MITIAAVIPLYNGQRFIVEAIQSVLYQTRPVDEIIIVNDGSSDQSEAIVRERFSDNRIVFVNKKNGGQSSARNFGVDKAKSSHIAFLDQDDLWHKRHIEILISPFEKCKETAVVYGNLDRIDERGWLTERFYLDNFLVPHPKKRLHECLSQDMYILPSASIIDKSAFKDVCGFDERLSGYEDDDLFLRLFVHRYKFFYINEPVTSWRLHLASTSNNVNMAKSRMIYFDKLVANFPDQPKLNSFWTRDLIVPRFINILIAQMDLSSNTQDTIAINQYYNDLKKIILLRGARSRIGFQISDIIVKSFLRVGLIRGAVHFIKREAFR